MTTKALSEELTAVAEGPGLEKSASTQYTGYTGTRQYGSSVSLGPFREYHYRAAGSASCPAQHSASLDLAFTVTLSGLQLVQYAPASVRNAEPYLLQSFFMLYF